MDSQHVLTNTFNEESLSIATRKGIYKSSIHRINDLVSSDNIKREQITQRKMKSLHKLHLIGDGFHIN